MSTGRFSGETGRQKCVRCRGREQQARQEEYIVACMRSKYLKDLRFLIIPVGLKAVDTIR